MRSVQLWWVLRVAWRDEVPVAAAGAETADEDAGAVAVFGDALLGEGDHLRVEIKAGDVRRAEREQDFDPYAAPAADFKHPLPGQCSARADQQRCLKPRLRYRADRIIHQCEFERVQFHRVNSLSRRPVASHVIQLRGRISAWGRKSGKLAGILRRRRAMPRT
jgi:hypothetical protein